MPREIQVYEPYWKLTLAYTDIEGTKFNNSLRIILDYIDEFNITEENYSDELYEKLQCLLCTIYEDLNEASVRKIINTYVKLGFVNYHLNGYHNLSRKFLSCNGEDEKKVLFSKIVYENSSFDRSITENSSKKEINFLLKTLAYSGPLTEDDRTALMLTKIETISKGFLNRKEIEEQKRFLKTINFDERKYNQISYLSNILGKLVDVYLENNILYMNFDDIPDSIEELEKRDPYLHRLYKADLKNESIDLYNGELCYVEKLDYPSLVASHIKPFIKCNPEEQYNKNNGLLLSRGMDALFDKGYISFNDDGSIVLSERLSEKVKEKLKDFSIDKILLNKERLTFLKYNRESVFK